MDCKQFESRIQNLLDHRHGLHGDRALQQHARQCAACHERLEFWAAFEERWGLSVAPRSRRLHVGIMIAAAYAIVMIVPWWSNPQIPSPMRTRTANESIGGNAFAGVSLDWEHVLPSISARLSTSAAHSVMPFAKGLRPFAESVQDVTVKTFQRSWSRPAPASPLPPQAHDHSRWRAIRGNAFVA